MNALYPLLKRYTYSNRLIEVPIPEDEDEDDAQRTHPTACGSAGMPKSLCLMAAGDTVRQFGQLNVLMAVAEIVEFPLGGEEYHCAAHGIVRQAAANGEVFLAHGLFFRIFWPNPADDFPRYCLKA